MNRHALKGLLDRVERDVLWWRMQRRSPGRNFDVHPDDVVIVSYPRSGNTWTRFLIANLVWPEQAASFTEIERKVPDIYRASRAQLAATPPPRMIKSHEYFDPRYAKVINIVRDPRDVALSYYNYQRKTRVVADDYPVTDFVRRFITGALSPYGSWAENVASWLSTRGGRPDFLLLRYEDMLEAPSAQLANVAAFLGLARTNAELERAVSRSSAAEMRVIEQQDTSWSVTQKSRKDIPFVGSAMRGGWKTALDGRAVQAIEEAWGELIVKLGYELSSETPRRGLRDDRG